MGTGGTTKLSSLDIIEGMYPQNYTEEIYVLNILGLNRLASLRLRGT